MNLFGRAQSRLQRCRFRSSSMVLIEASFPVSLAVIQSVYHRHAKSIGILRKSSICLDVTLCRFPSQSANLLDVQFIY